MLKQRVITGLVLALVFISSVLFGSSLWISVLLAVILFAATRELVALCLRIALLPTLLAAAAFALLFWWSLTLMTPQLVYWQSLAGAVIWLVIGLSLPLYRHSGRWPLLIRILLLGLGLDLLWICVHALVFLHAQYGGEIMLYLFSLIWIADIGAYFSGRRFGRRKLAPAISPGKTWEGVLGGIAGNLLWIFLIYQAYDEWPLMFAALLAASLASVAISIVGDLFESILKREAGVKDSGKLLPGHGGVLDRIDSVIAGAPVFVAGLAVLAPA